MSTSEFPAFRPAEAPALAAPPSPTAFDVPKHKSRPSGRKRGPRRSLKKVTPVGKKPRGRPRKAIADKHMVEPEVFRSPVILAEILSATDQMEPEAKAILIETMRLISSLPQHSQQVVMTLLSKVFA